MVRAGNVFFCPNFPLKSDVLHNTWFVVICGGTPWDSLLCLVSTSKIRRYRPLVQGCNAEPTRLYKCFFIPCEWQNCFDTDSCLRIPEIVDIPLIDFLRYRDENGLIPKGQIDDDCYQKLIACLSNFQYDIARDHWGRIFIDPF